MMAVKSWQGIALQKQDHRDRTIAAVKPPMPRVPDDLPQDVSGLPGVLLDARELDITERPAEALASALTLGDLTSVEVTNAFLRRAAIAQKLVCLLLRFLP